MRDDPRDYIDWDEAREFISPFYAIAEPCESCGEPTFKGRMWNAEHELMIAVDCSCNVPDVPTCPLLIPILETCGDSVRAICKAIREHRATCSLCGPVKLPVKREPGIVPSVTKEAA